MHTSYYFESPDRIEIFW